MRENKNGKGRGGDITRKGFSFPKLSSEVLEML